MKNAFASLSSMMFVGAVVCAGPGCATPGDASAPEVDKAAPSPEGAEHAGSIALRIEQEERRLDVGRDAAGARKALEAILADPAITSEERDEATFALSRASEALGDAEGAVASLEKLMATHAEDHRWPLEEASRKRLRKLVTGSEVEPSGPRFDDEPVAPFAQVLAGHYTPNEDGAYVASMQMFGARPGVSDRLGTFNIGGAMREIQREKCPLCDDSLNVYKDISRHGSWVDIPAYRAKLGASLNVYYFDLGERKIPARYDELLPMPSAEIIAKLEKGEGVIAARERTGAPPVLLVAAPRAAQLAAVEEEMAQLTSLPTEPRIVQLPAALSRDEIQGVVRGARRAEVACYEALLKREPEAAGKLVLKFAVQGDGTVSDLVLEGDTAAMRDAEFQRCFADSAGSMSFPKIGKKTTVAYPLEFAPGSQPPAK